MGDDGVVKYDEMGVMDNIQDAMKEGVSDAWPRFLERSIPSDTIQH